jgi:hypothetical protein
VVVVGSPKRVVDEQRGLEVRRCWSWDDGGIGVHASVVKYEPRVQPNVQPHSTSRSIAVLSSAPGTER